MKHDSLKIDRQVFFRCSSVESDRVIFFLGCAVSEYLRSSSFIFFGTLTVSAYVRIQCGTATAFASGSGRFFSHIPYFTFSMLIFSVVHSKKRKEVPRR